MSEQTSDRSDRAAAAPQTGTSPPSSSPSPSSPQPPLTRDQLERWAELVAAGEAEFPGDLPLGQRHLLEAAVRRLRRARLVAFIARQIAFDLHRRRHRPVPAAVPPAQQEH